MTSRIALKIYLATAAALAVMTVVGELSAQQQFVPPRAPLVGSPPSLPPNLRTQAERIAGESRLVRQFPIDLMWGISR
jgi:hypothetical protein